MRDEGGNQHASHLPPQQFDEGGNQHASHLPPQQFDAGLSRLLLPHRHELCCRSGQLRPQPLEGRLFDPLRRRELLLVPGMCTMRGAISMQRGLAIRMQ